MPRGTTERGMDYGRIGNDYANAGYFNALNANSPLNEAGAYAHLGDLGLRGALRTNNPSDPTSTPELYAMANINNPALYNLPTYEGTMNTPIGQFGLQAGGLEDTAGIRGSYQPNANAQAMAQALLSLLGR